ncbi:MAG TPA: hypothetical protein VFQ61_37265 [Polyangiaceae bacterium]|nr:hypothetical protein [Polyangiaceae bacterium]
MSNIQSVCDEMKGLEGTVGAFVWQGGRCLASSLPKAYDSARLNQIGSGLSRLGQLSDKAGYDRSACVFHWPRATLFSWPLPNAGVLAIVASPKVARGELELSVAIAMEELGVLLGQDVSAGSQDASTVPSMISAPVIVEKPSASFAPTAAAAPVISASVEPPIDDRASAYRLEQIESLLTSEVGPNGRAMLQRLRRQAAQAGIAEAAWLPRLRTLLLSELKDPCARAVVAASILFVPGAEH